MFYHIQMYAINDWQSSSFVLLILLTSSWYFATFSALTFDYHNNLFTVQNNQVKSTSFAVYGTTVLWVNVYAFLTTAVI